MFASLFYQMGFSIRAFARNSYQFLMRRVNGHPSSKDLEGKLFVFVASTAIFSGGVLLLLLASRTVAIGEPNLINEILGNGSLRFLLITTGSALVVSSLIIFPYVKRILNKKQTLKTEATHHVRNRAQQILLSLELLRLEETTTEGQKERIHRAERACDDLIDSLYVIESNDGERMD
jgi:hypothetical protein